MNGDRPLAGVHVVVTRPAHQAEELVRRLAAAGAEVDLLPLIEIVPPPDPAALERAASELGLYQWLVLTSANTVHALMPHTGGALPPALRVAVIGKKTGAALAEYEITPEIIAEDSRAEGLAAALAPHLGRQERLLLPQAADARSRLAELLRQAGAEVVRVTAYDKRIPAGAAAVARRIFAPPFRGWVIFTSPSTVRNLAESLGESWPASRTALRSVSIGKVTSEELRSQGVKVEAEAPRPSDEDLVEALRRAVESRSD